MLLNSTEVGKREQKTVAEIASQTQAAKSGVLEFVRPGCGV